MWLKYGFVIYFNSYIFPNLFGDQGNNLRIYNGIVAIILFVTVLFANFAEAVAEGSGKAQAENLKKTRKDTIAKLLNSNGNIKIINANELKKGDIVLVETWGYNS